MAECFTWWHCARKVFRCQLNELVSHARCTPISRTVTFDIGAGRPLGEGNREGCQDRDGVVSVGVSAEDPAKGGGSVSLRGSVQGS